MRVPTTAELPEIAVLLSESGLPTGDLSDQDLSLFRIAGPTERLDGVGGLERYGDAALLRSVATATSLRGRGIAGAIVGELERLAGNEGVRSLYLLTESAERFFESRGYTTIERSDVPAAIRGARQFSSLCPDSATVMCKRVGG